MRDIRNRNEPKFPQVRVKLAREDSANNNVLTILAEVSRKMRMCEDVSPADIVNFRREIEAAPNYDEALLVVKRWVTSL